MEIKKAQMVRWLKGYSEDMFISLLARETAKAILSEMKRLRRIERAARKWDRAAGSVARRAAAVLALEQVLYETKKGKAVRRANRCVEVKP